MTARATFKCGHTYAVENWYCQTVKSYKYPRCKICQLARSKKRADLIQKALAKYREAHP